MGVWAYLWFLGFCRICILSATAAPSTSPVPARQKHADQLTDNRQFPHKMVQLR